MVDEAQAEKELQGAEVAQPKGHMIEVAKSGRARCRTCNEGIAKGDLRLGEETPNLFSESGGTAYRWHHLKCAATKKPRELKAALATYEGDIPERAELERIMVEWEATQHAKKKATAFPFADCATTARSKCMHCHLQLEKNEFRVAIERPAGSYAGASSPGYLHPRCVVAHVKTDPSQFAAAIAQNTVALSPTELEEVVLAVKNGQPTA